ncbi:MFS transporter [Nakamurella flavida]|uniref:MFS transporter n=1 Tax=Nakamurella flavida TaxID=363630 RepID=A0A938YCB7_9ACTN|nr:MFS transporter [Nakamurella flavida]MBM9475041.1 MFS transporter [Nakamurella flavida]MDP9776609.1 MFS family permease [Nakamurella flavida]
MTGLPWVIWGVGAGVYFLAVFNRTSLGVAGPMAADRLHVGAAALGTFVVLQLAVYAVMQIPTGILVDRYGARRMLLAATLVMGTAQLLFAVVDSYVPALLARGLLGMGDAMTYISVLRLVAGWFPARRYPTQAVFTGLVGMAGNVVATVPLTGMLHGWGWGPTFALAGGLSLAYSVLLLRPATAAPFRERDERAAAGPVQGARVWTEVKLAWQLPSGRLGFWVHLTTMACPTTFGVLWGYPYLTQGLGYAPSTAAGMLLAFVLGGVAASLVIGPTVARRPVVRIPIAVSVSLLCLVGWITLIAWPGGRPPTALVVAVVIALSIGGPASSVGFLLARDYNPRHRISTATGLVNVGGFAGAVLSVYLVGQILDLVDGGGDTHSLAAFRWAFGVFVVVTVLGLLRLLTWWRRTRAAVLLADARGESVPFSISPHRGDLVDEEMLAVEAAAAERDRRLVEDMGDPLWVPRVPR